MTLFSIAGCKDRYDIQLRDTDKSFLVVEGSLKVGQDSTVISLSSSVKVNEKTNIKPVLRARVSVEDNTGRSVLLNERGDGKYAINTLGLVPGSEYRLRIRTSDAKEYLSDYVVAKVTPPIDSISWGKDNGDLMIYANTHDPSNNTVYYKWDFDETWEIRSFYLANYRYAGNGIVVESLGYNYRCWKYNKSSTLNIATSAHLSSDVISEAPLTIIHPGSEKISVRYSILVRQESITKKAYEYLMMMKKNTESVGSIFDPLPSEWKGNIRCISNPDEGVIGFVTASSVTQKRIFITRQEADWFFSQSCSEIVRVRNHPDSIKANFPGYLPHSAELNLQGDIIYYLASIPTCVDCTKRGGDLAMPGYW